jgi:hypothetical protein
MKFQLEDFGGFRFVLSVFLKNYNRSRFFLFRATEMRRLLHHQNTHETLQKNNTTQELETFKTLFIPPKIFFEISKKLYFLHTKFLYRRRIAMFADKEKNLTKPASPL